VKARALAALAGLALLAAAPPDQRSRRPRVDDGFLEINREYFDLAAGTGGDFFFWGPGEFAANAAHGLVGLEDDEIVLRYGSLESEGRVEIAVPVDSGVGRMRVFAGIQKRISLTAIRPNGSALVATPGAGSFLETSHMLIATVADPEPGAWSLVVAGRGRYAVTVRGSRGSNPDDEMIQLLEFRFVRRGGRPGHEGWFPVEGIPAAGSRAICSVSLSGPFDTAEFAFEDGAGSALGKLALQRGVDQDAPSDTWLGPCRVPQKPFRLVVRGLDRAGHPYQRVTSGQLAQGQPARD